VSPEEFGPPDILMTGDDFMSRIGGLHLSNVDGVKDFHVGDIQNFEKVVSNLKVLARCRPDHKTALIAGLKQLG